MGLMGMNLANDQPVFTSSCYCVPPYDDNALLVDCFPNNISVNIFIARYMYIWNWLCSYYYVTIHITIHLTRFDIRSNIPHANVIKYTTVRWRNPTQPRWAEWQSRIAAKVPCLITSQSQLGGFNRCPWPTIGGNFISNTRYCPKPLWPAFLTVHSGNRW